jgi:hypothetical protein
MAWPVSGTWEARVSGVTVIKVSWAAALDAALNGLYGGTKTIVSLDVDGVGDQAAGAAAGDIEATGDINAGGSMTADSITLSPGGLQADGDGVFGGIVKAPRIVEEGATALQIADWTLGGGGAGWGGGAVVQQTLGTDQAGYVRVLVGAVPAANPTLTLAYADGNFPNTPYAVGVIDAITGGGGSPFVPISAVASAASLILTYQGTPIAGDAIAIRWVML